MQQPIQAWRPGAVSEPRRLGRLEDPNLCEGVRTLGLDVDRFDADRRGPDIHARVRWDFQSGVRGGIVTTPTVIVTGARYAGRIDAQVLEEVSADAP